MTSSAALRGRFPCRDRRRGPLTLAPLPQRERGSQRGLSGSPSAPVAPGFSPGGEGAGGEGAPPLPLEGVPVGGPLGGEGVEPRALGGPPRQGGPTTLPPR